jgi:hypothetical protein
MQMASLKEAQTVIAVMPKSRVIKNLEEGHSQAAALKRPLVINQALLKGHSTENQYTIKHLQIRKLLQRPFAGVKKLLKLKIVG